MDSKNLTKKILEYAGTFAFGGIGRVGVKAYNDYREYQEDNSWENQRLEKLDGACNTGNYERAIDIANEIITSDKVSDEAIRVAEWRKAKCLFILGDKLKDGDTSLIFQNDEATKYILAAEDQFMQYGNNYGWGDDVVFMLMLIQRIRNFYKGRSLAILLMASDNNNYREIAKEVYQETTSKAFEDYNMYLYTKDTNPYCKWDDVSDEDYEEIAESSKFTVDIPVNHKVMPRKYIYIGRDVNHISGTYMLYDKERIVNWIFTLDQLPPDLVFPLGNPQPGLYMVHPIKTEEYYPIENAEESLFMEKVREFCWLVQCLGAREVTFHSNKGMSVSEGYGSSMNVEANVGVKGVNVGGGYGNSSRYDGSRSSRQQVEKVQHFDPKKKAYCPDDLVWLDSDPAWKDLIKQRLNGNMLDYTYKISSSETCQMSSSEKDEVKANFEYMMVKVNGSYNSEKDNTFSSIQDTEWSIHVEFAPMSELKEDEHSNINNCNNMKTSFNGVPEFTADVALEMNGGRQITEAERPEYERRRKANFAMPVDGVYQWKGKAVIKGKISTGCINISEESRIVIVDSFRNVKYGTCEGAFMFNRVLNEADCDDNCGLVISGINPIDIVIGSTVYLESEYKRTKQGSGIISSSEQDYLDEVKETIEDYGKIGPIERKHLEKTRNRLGISERRAAELEASINQVALTDDEQEYLDEVKEVREDYGEIGPKERKYLEKTRVRLGISVERAEELERM